jgi:hypothetical protein
MTWGEIPRLSPPGIAIVLPCRNEPNTFPKESQFFELTEFNSHTCGRAKLPSHSSIPSGCISLKRNIVWPPVFLGIGYEFAVASPADVPFGTHGETMNLPNEVRWFSRFLMIAFITADLGSSIARADITYNIDVTITSADPTGNPLQSDTVDGSITTDGTIGVIQTSDILSFNLNLIDNLNSANDYDLTPADSAVYEDIGDDLTASATSLFFNFGGAGGEFLIQHVYSSGYNYFCLSATGGACLAGETIAPNDVFTDGVVATGSAAPVGTQPLGPPTSAVPEPSSVISFATMLAGVAFWARKRTGRAVRTNG